MNQIALNIISTWVEKANSVGLTGHQKNFMVIQDLIKGKIKVPEAMKTEAITFLQSCKPTMERDYLLDCLKQELNTAKAGEEIESAAL